MRQLTLATAYAGDAAREESIRAVPQTLAVAGAGTEVQTITVADLNNKHWKHGTPYFRVILGNFSTASGSQPDTMTGCLPWDAEDWQVEEEINAISSWWCKSGDCVTVTRREDPLLAPNGYVWSVYFDGGDVAATNVPQLVVDGNNTYDFGTVTEARRLAARRERVHARAARAAPQPRAATRSVLVRLARHALALVTLTLDGIACSAFGADEAAVLRNALATTLGYDDRTSAR